MVIVRCDFLESREIVVIRSLLAAVEKMIVTFLFTVSVAAFALTAGADCDFPYFPAPSLYDAGPAPYVVEVANINRDAWPDLVVGHRDVNFREQGLSVLYGKPGGALSEPVVDLSAGMISSIAVADFDRDGDDDLAVSDYIHRRIRIMMNQSGALVETDSFETPQNNAHVLAGDFDGDGNPDFVVAGSHGSLLEVRWGNGDGTFTPASIDLGGGSLLPQGLSRDLDGDSRDDLILLESSRNIRIVNGQPQRDLHISTTHRTSYIPTSVIAGDIDGNREIDLLITFTQTPLQVIWNVGRGAGATSTTTPPVDQTAPFAPAAMADLDGDGADELVQALVYQASTFEWEAPQFRPSRKYMLTGGSPSSIRFADLNLDTIPDLIAAGSRGITVIPGGRGSLQSPQLVGYGYVDFVGDLDLDGRDDLLVGGEVWRSLGNGLFSGGEIGNTAGLPSAVGFLNGDAYQDFVYVRRSYDGGPATLSVVLSNGDGTWSRRADHVMQYPAALDPSPVIADFDGDGHGDLAAVLLDEVTFSRLFIFLGDSTGSFKRTLRPQTGTSISRIFSGDFDGDGRTDLVIEGNQGLYIAYNNGGGSFSSLVMIDPAIHSGPFAVADLDRDGTDDLMTVAPDWEDSFLSVRLGRRNRTFTGDRRVSTTVADPLGLQVRDIDGDGLLDALVTFRDGYGKVPKSVAILLGDGNGDFGNLRRIEGTGSRIWIGDFGGDGVADLLDGGFLRSGQCHSRRRTARRF